MAAARERAGGAGGAGEMQGALEHTSVPATYLASSGLQKHPPELTVSCPFLRGVRDHWCPASTPAQAPRGSLCLEKATPTFSRQPACKSPSPTFHGNHLPSKCNMKALHEALWTFAWD